ncbi:MAG: linear amide C-N hydrolase [Flavisolibacter sp.]|jgi:choloylglycine hydrolase|nr:linear amide C-N hydrolase [Flavisolibacter sp.]
MKKIIAIAFFILYANFSFACSTFLLKRNEKLVFGKNYDWVTGNGMVVVNARGVQKTSFTATGEKSISWRSNWGSITFNQFGKEFPNGGMNEKGLVVELMWLPGTKYPPKDNRAAMNELQWIQFQLDNCSTVDEVIATDKIIRISNDNFAPLHYLIADANGNAATIEFIERKMVVHKGKDLEHPVLTNTVYNDALIQLKENIETSFDNSVQRFSIACTMVQQFQTLPENENAVNYAFTILDKVAQGSYTKWSIIYDIASLQIHFKSNDINRNISFDQFDFACNNKTPYFNLNNPKSGMVFNSFNTLSFLENKNLLFQSVKENSQQLNIPELVINNAAEYFNEVKCK